MADWSSQNITLTAKGASALSKVQAGSGSLTITKVVASEQYVAESTLREVTSLSVENLPLTIIDRHEVQDGGSVIQVQLSNLYLGKAFTLNEIGVFATHSDNPSEEFLYIIAQVDAETGDKIPLYATTPVTATYDIYLYNVGADNIEITISSAGLVTYEALNKACDIIQRNTAYEVGDILHSHSLKKGLAIKCTVAGITKSTDTDLSHKNVGDTVEDGTSQWVVIAPSTTADFDAHNHSVDAHPELMRRFIESGVNVIKRSHSYAKGDIAYSDKIPSWAFLECTVAGTTSDGWYFPEPSEIKVDDTIVDYTVTWKVRKVADTASKLSTARKINITGNASGSATFDGSGDVSISITVNESKHAAAADTLKSSEATETSTVARPVWLSWEGDNTKQTVSPNLTYTCSTKTLTAANFKGHLAGNADTATKATSDANGNELADAQRYMHVYDLLDKTNFDNVKTTGIYTCTQDNYTNRPVASWGVLRVYWFINNNVKQEYVPDDRNEVWERYFTGGKWNAWSKVNAANADKATKASVADVVHKAIQPRGVYGNNGYIFYGTLTIPQNGDFFKLEVLGGNGHNSSVNQSREGTLYFRAGNGEPANYAAYSEYHRNGADGLKFFVVKDSGTKYHIYSGVTFYTGTMQVIPYVGQNSSFDLALTTVSALPDGAVEVEQQQLIYASTVNNYAPTKTGSGASGTWGINITGNAASATNADKLDGYHASDLFRHLGGNQTPVITDIFDRAGTIDMTTMSAADKATHKANINKASNAVQDIWNNFTGIHAYGGDYDMAGYDRGTLKLTQSYKNFDKILVVGVDDKGYHLTYKLWDVWALANAFAGGSHFHLFHGRDYYWYLYGSTRKGTNTDYALSTDTVWSCQDQNSGVVAIYGIKY